MNTPVYSLICRAQNHGHRSVSGLVFGLWLAFSLIAHAVEWTGQLTAEVRGYPAAPRHDGQRHNEFAVQTEWDIRHRFATGPTVQFRPFARLDPRDKQQPEFDLREFSLRNHDTDWGWRIGIGQVTWGASDVHSIVDLINQTDGPRFLDDVGKLGQPLLEASIFFASSTLTFYYLPYFREMPFPDERGRLRPAWSVDTDHPVYEAGSARRTVDYAARWQFTHAGLDVAVHGFQGRNRTPYLIPDNLIPEVVRSPSRDDEAQWVPVYEQITQTGLEAQWVIGGWLWKGEFLYRDGLFHNHVAGIGGFEYTLYNVMDSQADVSIVMEYAYDGRGKRPPVQTIFDNDLFIGGRLQFSDQAGTQLEGGLLWDVEDGETILLARARRRLGSHQLLQIDGWHGFKIPDDSPLYDLRSDHLIRIQWTRFF